MLLPELNQDWHDAVKCLNRQDLEVKSLESQCIAAIRDDLFIEPFVALLLLGAEQLFCLASDRRLNLHLALVFELIESPNKSLGRPEIQDKLRAWTGDTRLVEVD